MKKIFTLLIICCVVTKNFAQTTGDYQTVSNVTGNWNGAGTWERYNGTSFVATATPPSSADGVITVRAGANVSITSPVTTDQTIIETGGTLTQNNQFTIADGTGDDLTVNGTWLWNDNSLLGSGNILITASGNFTLATGNNKNVGPFNVTNNGTIIWQDGLINFGNGSSTLTNNGQFTITGNNSMVGNTLNYNNTGTITKTSSGVTSFSAGGTFTNSGTTNFNAGILEMNMATTNTGLWSFAGGTLNTSPSNQIFNWNNGASISGTGTFNNGGTLILNSNLIVPSTITFTHLNQSALISGAGNLTINNDFTNGGQIEGAGDLVVTGNMNWTQGSLSRSYTIPIGKTLSLTTGNQKNSSGFAIINNGTINWEDGFINLGTSSSTLTNNGLFTIIGNNDLNCGVPFTFLNNGTIAKTGMGSTTFSGGNVSFNNTGTLKGIGTFNFNITGFVNNGIIAPGNSPGIFTVNNINGIQPLSANSNLQIEMLNATGPGTGHDQLIKNGSLTLAGTLTVSAIGTLPAGTYTIINLTSGTISGNFTTVNIPPGTTLQINATNVQLIANTVVLPLNLLSFSGNKQNNNAVLQWKTANEINLKHFEIQRSIDGLTFVTIGSVATGGSLYSFTDINTFSSNTLVYYRLKSVDIDARFTYSSIIKLIKQTNAAVTVYPNPVCDVLIISGLKQNGSITLYNLEGKLLQQQTISTQTMTMDMSQYVKGMYLLQYKTESFIMNQKIIKQ